MQRFDITLPTPAQNLAFDEALLEWAEKNSAEGEFLRLWESPEPMVVVGRSSRVAAEVNEPFCRQENIPVLRRSSGGAAIVAGPGCLMYAVVLSYVARPELRMLDRAHDFVLSRIAATFREVGLAVSHCGTSDLALDGKKFSGNSLRCKR